MVQFNGNLFEGGQIMKRHKLLALGLLFAVGCNNRVDKTIEPASNSYANPNTIQLSASMTKSSYGSRDDVNVHLVLTLSGATTNLDLSDHFHDYTVTVIAPSRNAAQMSQAGIELYSKSCDGSHQYGSVGPRYSDVYDFPLSRLYDLSSPGGV